MLAVSPAVFYCIPGLGADDRVFQFLRLQGDVRVLSWLLPELPNEPLPHYAARLAAAIPLHAPCWLVGVSFGGVLAVEMARLRPLARVVLISSLASPQELPWIARLGKATGLYRLLKPRFLQQLPRVAQWFFGAKNGAEYQLLLQIIRDTDPRIARWAIAQLLHWTGRSTVPVIRIHGTHDRLLPAGATRSEFILTGGGHFMIVSHAARISQILNQLASEEPHLQPD